MQSHTSECGSSRSQSSRTSQKRSSAAVARETIRWAASSKLGSGSFNRVGFNGIRSDSGPATKAESRSIRRAAVDVRERVTRTGRKSQC